MKTTTLILIFAVFGLFSCSNTVTYVLTKKHVSTYYTYAPYKHKMYKKLYRNSPNWTVMSKSRN